MDIFQDTTTQNIGDFYILDLEKAHVSAHFRKNHKTGKLEYIHDYDDKRHAAELHVKYEKGDRVKITNKKSSHYGKEGTIHNYDSKWDDLWIDIDGHRRTAFKPHHPEHLDETKKPGAFSGQGNSPAQRQDDADLDKKPSDGGGNSPGHQGGREVEEQPERKTIEEPLSEKSVQELLDLIHKTGVKSPERTVKLHNQVVQDLTLMDAQIVGAEQILTAYKAGQDGFLLADGTGQGKTRTAAAVLAHMKEKGVLNTGLIVVPNDGIRRQWIEVLDKAGIKATSAIGTATDFSQHDGILISTYNTFSDNPTLHKSKDLVVFDEAHKMKNLMGKQASRAEAGETLIDQQIADGKKVLYLTATPYERPWQAKIYKALGLWPEDGFGDWLSSIGVKVKNTALAGKKTMQPFKILDEEKVFKGMLVNYIKGITSGVMIARETPIEGVTLNNHFTKVEAPQGMDEKYHAVLDFLDKAQSKLGGMEKGQISGQRMFWSRRFIESMKIPETIKIAKQELASGRQVAIMVGYREAADTLKRLQGMRHLFVRAGFSRSEISQFYKLVKETGSKVEGSFKTLQKAFGKDTPVVEYHGGLSNKTKEQNKQAYNSGKAKVIIATQDAADTGLSLHDTIGGMPRTQINVTLPWTAMNLKQLAGRSYRLKTKSDVTQHWLFSDVEDERKRAELVAYKLRLLGANVKGVDVQENDDLFKNLFKFQMGEDMSEELKKSLMNVAIRYYYILDLIKAHVKAHFRKNPKTGKLEWIEDYDDARHAAELHVKYEKGDRITINNPKSKYHGKEGTIHSYDSKWDDLWINIDGHQKTAFKPHHPVHNDLTKRPKDGTNAPVVEKKDEPKKVPEKVEAKKEPEPQKKPSDYFNDPAKAYEVAPQEYRDIANACGIMPVDDAAHEYMLKNIKKLEAQAKWVGPGGSNVKPPDYLKRIVDDPGKISACGIEHVDIEDFFKHQGEIKHAMDVLPSLLQKPMNEWEEAGYNKEDVEDIKGSIVTQIEILKKDKRGDYAIIGANALIETAVDSAYMKGTTVGIVSYFREKGYSLNTPIKELLGDPRMMAHLAQSVWSVGKDFISEIDETKIASLLSKASVVPGVRNAIDPDKVTIGDALKGYRESTRSESRNKEYITTMLKDDVFGRHITKTESVSGRIEEETIIGPKYRTEKTNLAQIIDYLLDGAERPQFGSSKFAAMSFFGSKDARMVSRDYARDNIAEIINPSDIKNVVEANLILATGAFQKRKRLPNTILFKRSLFTRTNPLEIGLKILRKKSDDLMDTADKVVAEYEKNKGKKTSGHKTDVMFKTVDRATYDTVEKYIKNSWDHQEHGRMKYKIHGVYELGGTGVQAEFQKIDKARDNTKFMYHGTDFAAASNIVKTGFLVPKVAKAGRMLGNGVYLTPVASKSCQYLAEDFTRKAGTRGILFVNKVSLGNAQNMPPVRGGRKEFPQGADSVYVKKGQNGIRNDEYCVKDPKAVMPKYWVDVEII